MKTAGKTWFGHLKNGLLRRGFKLSEIDPCVFLREDTVLLVYVDDVIIISKKESKIKEFIQSLRNGPENMILQMKGVFPSIWVWTLLKGKTIDLNSDKNI